MDKGGSEEINRPCTGSEQKQAKNFFYVNLGLAESTPSSGGDGNVNRGGALLVMSPQADIAASSLVDGNG